MEENAISSERGLNDDFVEQFAALNSELTTSDIDGWFHADEPDYEYLDEQGIVDLVSGHSLTNSSYNISSGVQSGGRVVLTTDKGLRLDGSVPYWSDTRH